jgi:hypothetical protein
MDKENFGETLREREIFRTGTWNGRKFTRQDLDDIVSAASEVGFKPPLKLGHAEKSGDPAYGWVENIKRVGNRLIADFVDIPDELAAAIKERRFDNVSAEIFFNLRRGMEDGGAKLFRRALKAVAILGAETPAVSNLKPLSAFSQEFYAEEIFTETPDKESPVEIEALKTQIIQLQQKLTEQDTKLHEQSQQLKAYADKEAVMQAQMRQQKIKEKVDQLKLPAFRDHVAALYSLLIDKEEVVKFGEGEVNGEKVLDELVTHLNKKTTGLVQQQAHRTQAKKEIDNPGTEVNRRAEEVMRKDSNADYFTAVRQVLSADEELASAYTFGGAN